jgi:hypothetical protein
VLGDQGVVILPVGGPLPSPAAHQFVLSIQNQDDGRNRPESTDSGAGEEPVLPEGLTSQVQITGSVSGAPEQLANFTLASCQMGYLLVDCLDRPVRVAVTLPNGALATVVVNPAPVCINRTFYILRQEVPDPDDATQVTNVYRVSEANSIPRCNAGGNGFGG